MALLYRVKDFRDGSITKYLHLPRAIERLAAKLDTYPTIHTDGKVKFNSENSQWPKAAWMTPQEALKKATTVMKKARKPGVDVFITVPRKNGDGFVNPLRIFTVEDAAEGKFVYSGTITPAMRKACEKLYAAFPQGENWGVYNCRRIAGSSTWSEHSWGAANDIHFDKMSDGDKAAAWLKKNYGSQLNELLWRVPSHYDHIHWSLKPDHTGTPPCA